MEPPSICPMIAETLICLEVVIWKFVTLLCSTVTLVASPMMPADLSAPVVSIKSFTYTFVSIPIESSLNPNITIGSIKAINRNNFIFIELKWKLY